MALTRDEILDQLERMSSRHAHDALRGHRDLVDEATLLQADIGLDDGELVDLIVWLGRRVGRRFTADEVSIEDFATVDAVLALAARYEPGETE